MLSLMSPNGHPVQYEVRPAEIADAEAMGSVHVRAWRAAYRDLLPKTYLDGLDPSQRATTWSRLIANLPPGQEVNVIIASVGVVGFASLGSARDEIEAPEVGEIYAINLDPGHWGRGMGRALLRDTTSRLEALGFGEAVLWVAVGNSRAETLYRSEGWAHDGATRTEEVLGVTAPQVRYRRAFCS